VKCLVVLAALAAACDPYRDGERLLVSADPRAAAAIHPRDARGHKLRAQALLAARELSEARLEARFALAQKPRDAEAWLLLARIELIAGRPGAAFWALEAAVRRAPDRRDFDWLRGELLYARGVSLRALGLEVAADRDLVAAERLEPGLATSVEAARRSPWRAAAAAGDPEPALFDRVRELARRGAHESALELLIDWVAEDAAVHARGPAAVRLLASLKEYEAAIALQQRMVDEDSADVNARLELARLYVVSGRAPRAAQEIDEAVWAAPDRAAAMRQAAEILEQTGQRRQACAWLSRALAFGIAPDGLRALGECLLRDGQLEQAHAVLDRACSLDPACNAAAK